MAELGVSPPTGLFPQPPQPPSQGALSDPTKMLDLFGSALRNQQLQQELKGRAAVGQAVQGALGPGGFDIGAFQNALKSNPDAAYFALPALQEGQNNARTQLDRLSAQEGQLRQVVGSLTGNETPEELRHIFTSAVRGGVDPARAIEVLSTLTGRNKGAIGALYRNMGLDVGAQSQRTQGEPGPGGAQQTTPLVGANRSGTIATTLPAYAGESIAAMQKDQQIQSGYATEVEPIRQALDKLEQLRSKYGAGFLGPGNDSRQAAESWAFSWAPKLATTLGVDPAKIQAYDELKKYLVNATQTRGVSIGAHSDQQWATAASGSPSTKTTDLAVPELLKVMYGIRSAEYAQHRQAVVRGGVAGEEYLNEKSNWPSRNDPRAFMMPLLSPEEQDKVISSLPKGSPERQRFNNSLNAAYESGVANRPGKSPAAAPATPASPAKPEPKPGKRSESAPSAPAKSPIATYPRIPYDQENVQPGKQSQAAPPMPGARLAADGHWYVRQPHANGDYQRVVMTG